jgi:hypothetical protein
MRIRLLFAALVVAHSINTTAQTTVTAQLRPRAEVRSGFGTLMPKDAAAAAFVSQRARLSVLSKLEKVNFGLSVQDVRIWGQDASTINNSDGSRFGVHEAWAEIGFLDSSILSLKMGRQELLYDDSRLLGNLDWLQQGRRHDAAVLKFNKDGWQVDMGAAFNQNTDAFGVAGTFYTPGNTPATVLTNKNVQLNSPAGFVPTNAAGNPILTSSPSTNGGSQMYKMMQYLYIAKKVGNVKISGLLFKDDFAQYRTGTIGDSAKGFANGRFYDVKGVNSRITGGVMATGPVMKNVNIAVGAYAQTGNNRDGKDLAAYHFTAYASYTHKQLTFGLGYDILSGNDDTKTSDEDHRFDPLYGTPHKFWGFMDFFYVGTGAPTGGLANAYFKTKYMASKKLTMGLDIHQFSTAKPMVMKETLAVLDKNLGIEADFLLNYAVNKMTALEFGYCIGSMTKSMEYVKTGGQGKADLTPAWGYLMITVKPELFSSAKK